MAITKGQDVYLVLASTVVNGLTNTAFSSTTNLIDVTTQDSGSDAEFLAGIRNKTFSFEGKDDETDTYAYDELWTVQETGTAIAFVMGYGVKTTGKRIIYGSCLISGLELNNPYDSNSGFTCNFTVTAGATLATSTTTYA